MVQILNNGKIAVQSTRQREKTMTEAKSRFKIIYENILDDFDRLLSKERIFDKKTLSSSIKIETVEKGKEGS